MGKRRSWSRRKQDVPRHPNGKIKQRELTLTPERRCHGTVKLTDNQIADNDGRPSRPYCAVDAWAEIHGVTAEMSAAGGNFRARFAAAHFNALKAGDPARPAIRGKLEDLADYGARDAVWRALAVVGGPVSPAGSCLWHVIGLDTPLSEWALTHQANKAQSEATLIAMLAKLDAYYGGARRQ